MNIYETTLDYKPTQVAFLIIMYENHLGYTGFCIDTKDISSNTIKAGDIVYNIPKQYVIVSKYNLQDSPMIDNYLMDYHIKHYGNAY